MYSFKSIAATAATSLLFAASAQAASNTLQNLVAGATLTEGPVIFDGFTYEDVGGSFGDYAVTASSIMVTTFAFGDDIGLGFTFDPEVSLAPEEVFEIVGGFTATASGATITDVTLQLLGAGISGPFSFIEIGLTNASDSSLLALNELTNFGSTPSDTANLGGVGSFGFGWDAQGEADVDGLASLSSFSVTLTLERDPVPPDIIPLPATLPLLLGGVGLMALARRRRT